MRDTHPLDYIDNFESERDPQAREIVEVSREQARMVRNPVSVSERIKTAISQDLKAKLEFSCSHANIQLLQIDPELRKIADMVSRQRDIQVEIKVEPQDRAGRHNAIPISCRFNISGADRKNILVLRRKKFNEEEFAASLKKNFEDWTQEFFRHVTYDRLMSKDKGVATELAGSFEQHVYKKAISFNGSGVTLVSLDVGSSRMDALLHRRGEAEVEAQEELIESELQKIRMQLRHNTTVIEKYQAIETNLLDAMAEKGAQITQYDMEAVAEISERIRQARVTNAQLNDEMRKLQRGSEDRKHLPPGGPRDEAPENDDGKGA
jgi:hypothetical protein